MNIKIIGSNCSNGIKLKKNVKKIINDYDGKVKLELLDDEKIIRKHNVKNVPCLIINDKKVCEGKVLTDRELLRTMKLLEQI